MKLNGKKCCRSILDALQLLKKKHTKSMEIRSSVSPFQSIDPLLLCHTLLANTDIA